jgi:dihydroneopterin aldolase
MDIIFLEQVKVQTKLGVPQWERMVPQTIILDIEIGYDYGAVVGRIRETLTEHSFQLVEALAEHICQLILKEFDALSVKIKVAKPAILPGLKALGVVIERNV